MSFNVNEIIRNKKTGVPYRILDTYKNNRGTMFCLVVNMTDSSNPTPIQVLLERDFDSWVSDLKLDMKTKDVLGNEPEVQWTLVA